MGDGPPARAPEAAGSRSGCAVTPRGDAGKPWETMGRRARGCRTATFAKRGPVLCSFGDAAETKGALANHWKQWDAKPEAVGRGSALSSFGCMANHGKPWGAKLWGLRVGCSGGIPLNSFRRNEFSCAYGSPVTGLLCVRTMQRKEEGNEYAQIFG